MGWFASPLKKMRIPWKTPERNADGSPKSGMLHRLDINGPPRPAGAVGTPTGNAKVPVNQHGYGHGPAGAPMQGPTGIPFLKGLTIQQNPLFNQDGTPKLDAKGKQMASRTFSTFRVVSSKHEGTKWKYPGIEGTHFFEEALQWAEKQWENEILPQLLKKLGAD